MNMKKVEDNVSSVTRPTAFTPTWDPRRLLHFASSATRAEANNTKLSSRLPTRNAAKAFTSQTNAWPASPATNPMD